MTPKSTSRHEQRVREMLKAAGFAPAHIGERHAILTPGFCTQDWAIGSSVTVEYAVPSQRLDRIAQRRMLENYLQALRPLAGRVRFVELHPFMACNFCDPHVHVAY